jgi:two-component sensor histidine kinase
VKELANGLMSAYSVGPGRVTLVTDVEDVPLNLDTAIPVGLILNELITNALTHGFAGGARGTLRIVLSREDTGRYYMAVIDDGRGMPEEVTLESPSTVGLTLVTLLAKQLGGSTECRRDGGTTFVVRFGDSATPPTGANGEMEL